MLTSIFPMGGSGGGELKSATGTISTGNISPRNVLTVTGLDFKPVAVFIYRESGNNGLDVLMAFVSDDVSKYFMKGLNNVSSHTFSDDGFSVTIRDNWGWDGTVHRWYAYSIA